MSRSLARIVGIGAMLPPRSAPFEPGTRPRDACFRAWGNPALGDANGRISPHGHDLTRSPRSAGMRHLPRDAHDLPGCARSARDAHDLPGMRRSARDAQDLPGCARSAGKATICPRMSTISALDEHDLWPGMSTTYPAMLPLASWSAVSPGRPNQASAAPLFGAGGPRLALGLALHVGRRRPLDAQVAAAVVQQRHRMLAARYRVELTRPMNRS